MIDLYTAASAFGYPVSIALVEQALFDDVQWELTSPAGVQAQSCSLQIAATIWVK